MEKELFTLLRLGLGNTTIDEENLSDFIVLTTEQWVRIGDLARKQGVLGIMLDGLDQIIVLGSSCKIEMPAALRLEWIGEVLQMELRNRQQIVVMNDLAEKWKQQGCRVMVMKGQANGVFYPKPEHRNPGDIDCYLFENYARGNEIARQEGANVDESWYKHSVINYKGETFENHQYFVHTRDGKRGKRLNEELVEQLKDKSEEIRVIPGTVVEMPPVQWVAMFLTYHACGHFISEGLTLKQILDWAMFLKKHQNDVDWGKYYEFCSRHHLSRFADVSTSIAKTYLGIKMMNSDIQSESPYTERVLHSALYDDDYVFGSGKGDWYNRFHLIKNLWTYRWKYRDIYQMSPLRQLWYYATGFIFKTE